LTARTQAVWPRAAALGLASWLLAGEAAASPLDTHGFGSRETGMGTAVTAETTSFAATFYNPAGLARAPRLELSIGYLHVEQRLALNGNDNKVDPVKGVVGGVVAPGNVLGIPFAFGVATHLPDDRLSRVRTLKQEVPRWELYDNRAQILFIAAVLAVRPLPWLSVGGGVAFLSSTRGTFDITGTASLKSPYDSQLRHEVDADLTAVRIPILGVRVDPSEFFSAGLAFRGESKLDLNLAANVSGNVDPGTIKILVPVKYQLTSQSYDAFHPAQLAGGVALRPTPGLTLALDLVYTRWSTYKSATSQSTAHLEVDLKGVPLAIPPDPKPTVVRDPGFKDRLAPRVGVEWIGTRSSWFEVPLRAGYVFEPSPVPPQTGPTNFVDSDRHTVSVGMGFRVLEPLGVIAGDVTLDAHAAVSFLPERTTLKDNPSDYVGDYTREGRQVNLGATLGARF
jgi:long-chain fatty acid transport protein